MENKAYDHVAVAATVSNRGKGHVDLLALEKLNLSCPPSTHLPMSWAHVCCVHSLVFILFRSEEREREKGESRSVIPWRMVFQAFNLTVAFRESPHPTHRVMQRWPKFKSQKEESAIVCLYSRIDALKTTRN